MIERDSRCIFVARNRDVAEFLAGWLTQNGVAADVVDEVSPRSAANGIEVWAMDPLQVAQGIALLEQNRDQLASEVAKRHPPTGEPIQVVCEECGKEGTYAFATRGSVQTCPHCAAYVDVPGDDEEPFPEDIEPAEDE